jgi:hypothetical protein
VKQQSDTHELYPARSQNLLPRNTATDTKGPGESDVVRLFSYSSSEGRHPHLRVASCSGRRWGAAGRSWNEKAFLATYAFLAIYSPASEQGWHLGQVRPERTSQCLNLTGITYVFVLLSRREEHPALVEPAPVRLIAHRDKSLQEEVIPIQSDTWCILQLHMEGNLQIIQSLESVAPDSRRRA